ncbi:MAG: type II toxin-antitoxin system Phd/YefM family antitoxin [Nostoc sp. ChiSLP01]|nr:type II toxin-antitoxin system prevent-host-death family antitoxin [Nostoc sp. CmiSLP01]MDZ8286266.1 type II toxin-antitoxin system prevent-host-death family antitoxin [Nostoc sp. ChiSLP01]
MQISLADASAELVDLVEAALQGEEIVIYKNNHPVVKLTLLEPVQKRRPAKAGSAKGQVWMSEDFDEPLEDFKEYME